MWPSERRSRLFAASHRFGSTFAPAGPFGRLVNATDRNRDALLSNMTVYLPEREIRAVQSKFKDRSASAPALANTNATIEALRSRLQLLSAKELKLPLSFRAFQMEEPKVFRSVLADLVEREREGGLLVIGNGGAGVAGYLAYMANHPLLVKVVIIWHEGSSATQFQYMDYLHGAMTYEPHIELQKGLASLDGGASKLIFVNKLALFIPKDDPLDIVATYRRLEGAQAFSTTSTVHEKIMTAFWAAIEDHDLRTLEPPTTIWYASRFNHSAIGEHDYAMWALGAARHLIGQPATATPPLPSETDALLDFWCSKVVARLPTWYPVSILDDSIKYHLYHLNDTSFLSLRSAVKSEEVQVLTAANNEPVLIDNPCHLWWTSTSKDCVDAKRRFEEACDDTEYIQKWDEWISSGAEAGAAGTRRSPELPTFETPTLTKRYVQEYLAMMFHVQKVLREYYLTEWVHLNFAASVYAGIDRTTEGVYTITGETDIDAIKKMTEERLESKIKDLDSIKGILKQRRESTPTACHIL